MTERTPGPWTYLLRSYRVVAATVTGSPTIGPPKPYGLTDADALVADAAPELLAALEGLMAAHDSEPFNYNLKCEWEERARAAIAKAKGEE